MANKKPTVFQFDRADQSVLATLLRHFSPDEWKPSRGLQDALEEQYGIRYESDALLRTLHALSNTALVNVNASGETILDLRLLEQRGQTGGARYRLTPYGTIIRAMYLKPNNYVIPSAEAWRKR